MADNSLSSDGSAPDPYDDAVAGVLHSQGAQIRNNLTGATGVNADQEANYQHLAKFVGVPIDTVRAQPDAIKTQAALQSVNTDTLQSQAPQTSNLLSDPDTTKVVHDDISNLAAIEGNFYSNAQSEKQLEELRNLPFTALQGLGGSFNKLIGSFGTVVGALPAAADAVNSVISGQAKTPAADWYFKNMVQPWLDRQEQFDVDKNAGLLTKGVSTATNLLGTLSQIVLTGDVEAPATGLAKIAQTVREMFTGAVEHGVKAMALPATSDAISTGRQVFDATGDPVKSVDAALAQYGVTTLGGVVPMSAPGTLAMRLATGGLSGVVSGETGRVAMNAVLPEQMQQPFDMDNLLLSAVSGAVLGVGGPHADPDRVAPQLREAYVDAQRSQAADSSAQTISALGQLAAASKVRTRDPEMFHGFVDAVAQEHGMSDLYVEPQRLMDALNQAGVKPQDLAEKMPEVAGQLNEAGQIGADVRIPMADYLTHIAGGPVDNLLQPHLKTDPEGMSAAESQAYKESQTDVMAKTAEQFTNDRQAQSARDASGDQVEANFKQQLQDTGRFTPPVNDAYAKMLGDFYRVNSEKLGILPHEMLEQYPLNVRADALPDMSDAIIGQNQDQSVPDHARGVLQVYRKDITEHPTSIVLGKNADLSTFLHESGHFFLEAYSHMASLPNAPEGIKSDMAATLQHLGIADLDTFRSAPFEQLREAHETFARSFEAYLFEGKAPNTAMQSVFQRFRSWLVNVYRSVSSLRVNMSPELRGVFDRMLASSDAIDNAQQVRSMVPMFATRPEGMSEKEWQDYQALGSSATADAVDQLQAKSLRDMKWLSNAKSRAMKDLQDQAKTARDAIREEVTKEVDAEPVNRARAMLKAGEVLDEHGNPAPDLRPLGAPKLKLNLDAVRDLFPDSSLDPKPDFDKLRGMTAKNGMDPHLAAEFFGFDNGQDFIRALTEGEPRQAKIDGLTDQRMLERHGELTDPQSVERAAEAAIHNEARSRFVATELGALQKATGSARALAEGAKQAAEAAIAQRRIADLNPRLYAAAEASSAKNALELLKTGDTAGAAAQKRAQLLNDRLAKAAADAQLEVDKAVKYLKRFTKDSVRKRLDVDVREQIDDLLTRFDLRTNPTDAPTRRQVNLQTWVESQRAAGYEPLVTPDMLNPAVRMPYRQMSVEMMRGLRDTVGALEHVGQERKLITLDGQRVAIDSVVNDQLVPKMKERGDNFTKEELLERPENRLGNKFSIALDHLASWFRSAKAQLKPQEFKRNEYDNHELLGPFGKVLFDRVFDANYRKVDMLKGMSDDFQGKADALGRGWQDSLRDPVANDILMDPDLGGPMKLTRGRMVSIALHVGNESNFDKLTRGWNWKPEDVWSFLHDNMSEKDWQGVQAVWDQYAKHWPDMQAMAKRLGNTAPEAIEPRPFNTKFGESPGGYAAIKYDPLRSRRGEREASGSAIDPGQGLFGRDYFRPDTTSNGSMNARMDGYTDRVDLDFGHIQRALHDSIHDLAYREALIDANKIIEHPDFKSQFRATYGPEAYKSMQEWIGQLANSENSDRTVGALGKFLQYTRTGIVINGIAFRISTVLKHGGSAGIKSGAYFAGGGAKYLAARFARIGTNFSQEISGAQEKFGEIRARLLQQDRDYRSMSASLFKGEGLHNQAERFGHAAVAWSDMMTAVPTAWAAYDRAIQEGIPVSQGGTGEPMTEAQAVAYANKLVREAHGSNIESARSMILQNKSEAVKMFTTLYGFMNNTYGQMADAVDKLRVGNISTPAVLARAFGAIIVPALWAEFLNEGAPAAKTAGGWAMWAGKAIAGEVAGTVPFVRDAASMVQGYEHAGQVASESWLSTEIQGLTDVAKEAQGKSPKAPIKDIMNAAGTGLQIPGLGQLGGSIQYAVDAHQGKEHPTSTGDYLMHLATGKGTPAKH